MEGFKQRSEVFHLGIVELHLGLGVMGRGIGITQARVPTWALAVGVARSRCVCYS